MNAYSRLLALTAAAGALLMPSDATRAQLLITESGGYRLNP